MGVQLSFDEDTQKEKHRQKLFLDAVILRALKNLLGFYSETMQDEKRTEMKHFITAYKHKSINVSKRETNGSNLH
ncbi:hypothetical protein DPMN_177444 [Dreissena polymorpha]|uniref:Uncharacterized protein n=1 Tax=Dreissena polymorpha TaxID=45954 RepID=A0A9D4EAC1_DREPO|nr:hypothetical protein DPMN_177444 [Dreissena polymorpha]